MEELDKQTQSAETTKESAPKTQKTWKKVLRVIFTVLVIVVLAFCDSTVKLLGVKTETTFNPQTGVVNVADASGASSNILMTTNGAQGCAAIIVPQSKPSGFLLEIGLQNNDVLHYKTVQNIVFESGKVYTFNVKVIESDISVSTTVTPWDAAEDVDEHLNL